MRSFLGRFLPQSVRGQFAAIIVVAVIVILSNGSAVESFTEYFDLPAVEDSAAQTDVVATLLRGAPEEDRGTILAAAARAGFDFKVLPREQIRAIPTSYLEWQSIAWLLRIEKGSIDGRWIRIGGQYAFVVDLDQQSVLAHFGMPDSFLTSGTVRSSFYRFMAFVALPTMIWLFAVWTVTGPLKRISTAVGSAEIENGDELFIERGSTEMIGLTRALNRMRTRIRTMIENRTRMLRSVSHDLRTPLTRLRLRAERMDENSIRTAMLTDIQHIEDLISETLTYLRNDVSTEKLQRADIASVLQTVCAEFSDVGVLGIVFGTGPAAGLVQTQCAGACDHQSLRQWGQIRRQRHGRIDANWRSGTHCGWRRRAGHSDDGAHPGLRTLLQGRCLARRCFETWLRPRPFDRRGHYPGTWRQDRTAGQPAQRTDRYRRPAE